MIKRLFFFLRPGFLKDMLFRARLVVHLMRDRRVSFILKLIPLAALAYAVLPDFIPLPIDDIIVIGFGMDWFVKLCPKPIVQEHTDRLHGVASI